MRPWQAKVQKWAVPFEELAQIMDKVTLNEKLTVCFDTCHTHDAGYNLVDDFDGVVEEFDRIIGLDRLALFHINDSKNFQGDRKDRHAPLGAGLIGFDALDYIVNHEAAKDKPVILETPWIGTDKQYISHVRGRNCSIKTSSGRSF